MTSRWNATVRGRYCSILGNTVTTATEEAKLPDNRWYRRVRLGMMFVLTDRRTGTLHRVADSASTPPAQRQIRRPTAVCRANIGTDLRIQVIVILGYPAAVQLSANGTQQQGTVQRQGLAAR